MEMWQKVLLSIVGGLFTVLLVVWTAFQISPRPGAFLINRLFAGEAEITEPTKFQAAQQQVAVTKDLAYPSTHQENQFDLYLPKAKAPVLLWIHGGGYVGGDKAGMVEFATRTAADAHVAVVAMNYQLAPDSRYPNQLQQVDELVHYLQRHATDFPQLDLTKIFIGGDSAGAQIALQYATVQTNLDYAKTLNLTPRITKELQGTLSYCGPVDLQQVAHEQSQNRFLKFFVKTVAWSLLGTKDWQHSAQLQQASVVQHVTASFPPTFITDAQNFSFQSQGEALVQKLTALQVPVASLFFQEALNHEYQFDYALPEAQTCYQQTIAFLKEYQ